MVRRALGRAIRLGQADGTVSRGGQVNQWSVGQADLARPTDFAGKSELYGRDEDRPGIYTLAEADPDTFESAIAEAKDEGNLSRANVAR